MDEAEIIAALRQLPLHPGARALADDVAVIAGLVVTTDTLVEGVHFLPGDPPEDVAWKLVATNLSDLAAKGAKPEGVLLNLPLGEAEWDRAFLTGLGEALSAMDCALLGGDTVGAPPGAPRVLTMTALGSSTPAPPRSGARDSDALWVTGVIGDAGAGLEVARGAGAGLEVTDGAATLLAAYRRPRPRVAEGRLLGTQVHAMMDVSDGLLIDAGRMAAASGVSVTIDLAALPLSEAFRGIVGDDRAARIDAATAGDDYELLFALPPAHRLPVPATRVGTFGAGSGLILTDGEDSVPLPNSLGWLHHEPGL